MAHGRSGQGLRRAEASWIGSKRRQFKALMRIEEPYEYRDRLTMPKFIINASGDQFFLPDSSQFYVDGSARRNAPALRAERRPLARQIRRARERARVLCRDRLRHAPPAITWTFERDGRSRSSPDAPRAGEAVAGDESGGAQLPPGSRSAAATPSTDLTPAGPNTWVARVPRPEKGWTAFFIELTFASGGAHPFKETTGIRVVPDTMPFPPPTGAPK